MAKRQYSYTTRSTYERLFDIEVGTEKFDSPQPDMPSAIAGRLSVAIDSFGEDNVSDHDLLAETLAAYISDTMRKLNARVAWVRVVAAGSGVIHEIDA